MGEAAENNISVVEIMKEIKQKVKKMTDIPAVFQLKESYTYDDFLQYEDNEEFIKNLYLGLLKREADENGLRNHLNLLQSGENTKVEIISLLRESEEGRIANVDLAPLPFEVKECYYYVDFTQYDDEEFVRNVYIGILKREADNDGLNYYLELLKSGKLSKSEIIANMKSCDEGIEAGVEVLASPFHAKESYTYDDFTKYDDEEFVKNVYIGLLKREVDQVGLDIHLNLLKSGEMSKSEIVRQLRNSEEGQNANVRLRH